MSPLSVGPLMHGTNGATDDIDCVTEGSYHLDHIIGYVTGLLVKTNRYPPNSFKSLGERPDEAEADTLDCV